MKLSYQHLVKKIPSKPSIEEISDRLFQLGHENEIDEEIVLKEQKLISEELKN